MKPAFIIHYEDIYYSHSEFKKMPVHLLEEYPESIDLMEMIEFLSDTVKERHSDSLFFILLYKF